MREKHSRTARSAQRQLMMGFVAFGRVDWVEYLEPTVAWAKETGATFEFHLSCFWFTKQIYVMSRKNAAGITSDCVYLLIFGSTIPNVVFVGRKSVAETYLKIV